MEQIEYTRTVVPSSMRSPYWKYFGFPSDSGNNILTRQKIVCTICNTAIAYNKNTSNLRTHLMSKHVEIFQKLVIAVNANTVPKQDTIVNQMFPEQVNNTKGSCASVSADVNVADIKKRHSETHDKVTQPLQSNNYFAENFLTIPEQSINLEAKSNVHVENNSNEFVDNSDLEMESTCYNDIMSSNVSDLVEVTETGADDLPNSLNMDDTKNEENVAYTDIVLHEQQLHSMDIMLADMIQTDLLPLDILENCGFCKYNQQLTGVRIDSDTAERVMKVIEKRFINTKQMITAHVDRLSQIQPYSLSIEVYKDNDDQDILNIYFNYLNDGQTDLISVLYTTSIICTNTINISELLMNVNIKNCSGIVVSCLDNLLDFVLEFAKFHELPIIECLESMLNRCLHKIFEESEFSEDYRKLFKVMLENTSVKLLYLVKQVFLF